MRIMNFNESGTVFVPETVPEKSMKNTNTTNWKLKAPKS